MSRLSISSSLLVYCHLRCSLDGNIVKSWLIRNTVVPALGDPRRERPPAVYGHIVNVPTHFNVKLPLISGHLPITRTRTVIYWLSAPAITDNANKCHVFGDHFIATDSSLTFPCCRLVTNEQYVT